MTTPKIAVLGSVNLDIVATADRLPAPGETVTGAALARYPGGKGANQALAARRLGADVQMVGRVGLDEAAGEALALLEAGGVDLSAVGRDGDAPTGVALIAVAEGGENQIVVAPGANAALTPEHYETPVADALLCQLEIPVETLAAAAQSWSGFLAANLAPARAVPDALIALADLIIVNETEAAFYGEGLMREAKRVAVTYGARGAALFEGGAQIAFAAPPPVTAVDATGAGDAFCAALTLALLEGRPADDALRFACAVGALAATKPGAQPSFPSREDADAAAGAAA